MSIESERDKDLRRIRSINVGTPGHKWFNREVASPKEIQEIDPSKLNLNVAEDFLEFLNALNQGEQKSLTFLEKIPQERKDELKQIHTQFSGFFAILDQSFF